MISEDARIFGCSANPVLHPRLSTVEQCLGWIDEVTDRGERPNALAREFERGTLLRAHRYDPWLARQWIDFTYAERVEWKAPENLPGVPLQFHSLLGQKRTFGRAMVPIWEAENSAESNWLLRLEVLRVWQGIWNYFTALNVSLFAWLPMRIAHEDAYGHPRHEGLRAYVRDRAFETRDLDGDVVPTDSLSREQSVAHKGVIYRVDEGSGANDWGNWTDAPAGGVTDTGSHGWMRKRLLRQRFREARAPQPNATPFGVNPQGQPLRNYWATQPRWGGNARMITMFRNVMKASEGTNPQSRKHGMVPMHVYAFPPQSVSSVASVTANLWMVPFPGRSWTEDGDLTISNSVSSARRVARFFYERNSSDTDDWAVPSTKWYYEMMMAPMPGLRLVRGDENARDLSLVEYLWRRTTDEIIRETMLHVVVANLTTKADANIDSDRVLFGAAQTENLARDLAGDLASTQEVQRTRDMANRVIAGTVTAATAVNPVAGLIVGVAGLVASTIVNFTLRSTDETKYSVDVFGRLTPVFEVFSYHREVLTLESATRAIRNEIIELTGAVDPDEEVRALRARLAARRAARERELLEQGLLEVDERGVPLRAPGGSVTLRRDVMVALADPTAAGVNSAFIRDGVLDAEAVLSLPAYGRRTIILLGLDPAQGARVFGPDGREFTTGLPEVGGARWFDHEGRPAWVFGVPEEVRQLRVVVPGGPTRGVVVPVAVEGGTPQQRTAMVTVGEAPALPDQAQGIDLTVSAAPPGLRVLSADGRDLTQQRTFASPGGSGPLGWTVGIPLGTPRVVLEYPDGQRRTVEVPTEALRYERGVAFLTVDGTAPPPIEVPPLVTPKRGVSNASLAFGIALVVAAGAAGYVATKPPQSPRANPSRRSPRRRLRSR